MTISIVEAEREDAAPAATVDDLPGRAGIGGLAALATAGLAACGGGGTAGEAALAAADPRAAALSAGVPPDAGAVTPPVRPPDRLSPQQAARFLAQGAFGGTAAEIQRVQLLGFEGWLGEQFAQPLSTSYVALISTGGPDADKLDGRIGVERAVWRKLITGSDALRQRVTLALSEIFVISIIPVVLPQRGFACAAFMDILEGNAFGNYRDLLMQVSTSAAMGRYLTFLNNVKADPVTGSQPDENYARELMQLFTIGVLKLQLNGQPVIENEVPAESYTQNDVLGLARVFTGWVLNKRRVEPNDFVTKPMLQVRDRHELGPKTFLGETIAAGTNGETSLAKAIDVLMKHPNIGPFVGRQLIQRLVTSNPSPAYVERVARAFNGTSLATRGDMKATLRAVLLDVEARSSATLLDPRRGKVREPLVRFIQWARTFGLAPAQGGTFDIGNLSDPATKLGQSPLRAPSVFNFFRPGYVPSNPAFSPPGGAPQVTAPELQITTESSVAGYLNFMQDVVQNGIAGRRPDYTKWLPLAGTTAALLAELNVVMAAGQVSPATLTALGAALDKIDASTDAGKGRRLYAALTLMLAAPEYIVQK